MSHYNKYHIDYYYYNYLPLDTDNKGKLGFRWNVESIVLLGFTAKTDLVPFQGLVFLDIVLSTLKDLSTLDLVLLLLGNLGSNLLGAKLFNGLTLL